MARSDYWDDTWGRQPSTTWDPIRGLLTEEEWEAKGHQNQAALEKNMYKMGRVYQQILNVREQAKNNPELRELQRVLAWNKAEPGSVNYREGVFVLPDGWPDGIDPEEIMEEFVIKEFGPPPEEPNITSA